jgi:hypothetical protein
MREKSKKDEEYKSLAKKDEEYKSLLEADKEFNFTKEQGFVRVESCEVVTDDVEKLPDGYRKYHSLKNFSQCMFDKYLVFDAKMESESYNSGRMIDEDIKFVIAEDTDCVHTKFLLEYTGADSVMDLVNSRIPAIHVKDDTYISPAFRGPISGLLSTSTISKLMEKQVYHYSNGGWRLNSSIKKLVGGIASMTCILLLSLEVFGGAMFAYSNIALLSILVLEYIKNVYNI